MAGGARSGRAIAGVVLLLLAYVTTVAGVRVLREWSAVSATLAALGLVWSLAGIALLISCAWLFLPFGWQRFPLALGGCASLSSGALIIAGVLTHVVPCSGPA